MQHALIRLRSGTDTAHRRNRHWANISRWSTPECVNTFETDSIVHLGAACGGVPAADPAAATQPNCL